MENENTPRGNLPRGEVRTKKLKELFPSTRDFTREEILARLRQERMIGSGLLGRLKGEMIIRTVQPLEQSGGVTGNYFARDSETGKYHLTYAGGLSD